LCSSDLALATELAGVVGAAKAVESGGEVLPEQSVALNRFLLERQRAATATWGGILNDGRGFILRYPHIAIFPGLMIVITVLAFNFIGDGLRDALDPHQKTKRGQA
jgi:peptide/nickel transport system permease protein